MTTKCETQMEKTTTMRLKMRLRLLDGNGNENEQQQQQPLFLFLFLFLLFVVVFCLECAQFELRKWTHKMCSQREQGEECGVQSEGLR